MTSDIISRQAAIDTLKGLEFCQYMEFGEYIGEDTREVRLICAEKAQDALRKLPSAQTEQTKMIKEIRKWINSGNRGNADYFIVDKIEEIINKYE